MKTEDRSRGMHPPFVVIFVVAVVACIVAYGLIVPLLAAMDPLIR